MTNQRGLVREDEREWQWKASPRLWVSLSWAIVLIAFLEVVFRSLTQSIAHDEALTFVKFIKGHAGDVLVFDSNNHILFTLISKIFVHFLGPSEGAFRLASVIGAAIYLFIVHRLGVSLLGQDPLLPVSTALLALNPTVTDFLVAARGYSLGLGFLLLAVLLILNLDFMSSDVLQCAGGRRSLVLAGVALGLSIAANLTNVVPAFGLGLSLFFVVLGKDVAAKENRITKVIAVSAFFALPLVLTFLFFLWPYLLQIQASQFYDGHRHLSEATRDLFNSGFLYRWTEDVHSSLGAVPSPPRSWQSVVSNLGTVLLLPGLIVVVTLLAIWSFRLEAGEANAIFQMRIAGLSLIFSAAFIICMHVGMGVLYPVNRTCLYLIPFFTVPLMLSGYVLPSGGEWRAVRRAGLAIGVFIILVYLASTHFSYFRYNAFDERSREMFLAIRTDAESRGLKAARIGGTWYYEPEINFYISRYKVREIAPYDVVDANYPFQTVGRLRPGEYDYFIFTPKNAPDLDQQKTQIIFHSDRSTATIVAIYK
jgi:hypothetical protein